MEKKRILLVDDDRSFTNVVKLNLEETNQYTVRVENWPEDALTAVREFRPDLVLLDILMPRMPGGNVAAAIQHDPEFKDTPIVFLTAAVRKSRLEEHDGIICDRPTLAKPASIEKIIEAIEKFSRKSQPTP